MTTQDMGFAQLCMIYAMLAAPLVIMALYRLGLTRDTLISVIRMSVQLALVGLYLKFIFALNNPYLNTGWILVMIIVVMLFDSGDFFQVKLFEPKLQVLVVQEKIFTHGWLSLLGFLA